jgi:hypothetical protein
MNLFIDHIPVVLLKLTVPFLHTISHVNMTDLINPIRDDFVDVDSQL